MALRVSDQDDRLVLDSPARWFVGFLFGLAAIAAISYAIYRGISFEPDNLSSQNSFLEDRARNENSAIVVGSLFVGAAMLASALWYLITGPAVRTEIERSSGTITVSKKWVGRFSSYNEYEFSDITDTDLSSYRSRMFTDHVLRLETHTQSIAVTGRSYLSAVNDAEKAVRRYLGLR